VWAGAPAELVATLVDEFGLDPDERTHLGNSAVHLCVSSRNPSADTLRALLERSRKAGAKSGAGDTIAEVARANRACDPALVEMADAAVREATARRGAHDHDHDHKRRAWDGVGRGTSWPPEHRRAPAQPRPAAHVGESRETTALLGEAAIGAGSASGSSSSSSSSGWWRWLRRCCEAE